MPRTYGTNEGEAPDEELEAEYSAEEELERKEQDRARADERTEAKEAS
jgi:hypothetical protein